MAFIVTQDQYELLKIKNAENQLFSLFTEYTNEIGEQDDDLATRIRTMPGPQKLPLFTNIYNLTTDRYSQIALLAIIVSTGVDIFKFDQFSYILDHPYLNGDAKARHIIISCLSAQNIN